MPHDSVIPSAIFNQIFSPNSLSETVEDITYSKSQLLFSKKLKMQTPINVHKQGKAKILLHTFKLKIPKILEQ